MNIFILGAGAWGTAIAAHAARNALGHRAFLWSRSEVIASQINRARVNQKYLPDISVPAELSVVSDWSSMFSQAHEDDLVVIATPVSGVKAVVNGLLALPVIPKNWIWLCKGLDPETSAMPHQVIASLLPPTTAIRTGVLSGPSFAIEVARGLPCALTVASESAELVRLVQQTLHYGNLRIYGSSDVIGVELGGAVKNVLAIATGISDGLGLGLNARAALLTRGLSEMMRLVIAAGGKAETAIGLAGIGDLILTATGDLSRNRQVGLQLASGKKLAEILAELGHVAEGVRCAQAVSNLAKEKEVDMPITDTVCKILFDNLPARDAVALLMGRDPKLEG